MLDNNLLCGFREEDNDRRWWTPTEGNTAHMACPGELKSNKRRKYQEQTSNGIQKKPFIYFSQVEGAIKIPISHVKAAHLKKMQRSDYEE